MKWLDNFLGKNAPPEPKVLRWEDVKCPNCQHPISRHHKMTDYQKITDRYDYSGKCHEYLEHQESYADDNNLQRLKRWTTKCECSFTPEEVCINLHLDYAKYTKYQNDLEESMRSYY